MKQTAVERLELSLLGIISFDSEELRAKYKQRILEAKEIEKQQIIDACINTTQDCFKSAMEYMGETIIFTEKDILNQKSEAEQYYTETFKKE